MSGRRKRPTTGTSKSRSKRLAPQAQVQKAVLPRVPKPNFGKKNRLSELEKEWQKDLYMEKFNSVKFQDGVFVCERAVSLPDFTSMGITACFQKFGWEEALTFHDHAQQGKIADQAIKMWMATLSRDEGDSPPWTTTLTGYVGAVQKQNKMVMSFDTIKQVANFDTLDDNQYEFPSTTNLRSRTCTSEDAKLMINDLFLPGGKALKTSRLKIRAKLINKIGLTNVLPKWGDKDKVAHQDLRPLHALVTGSPILSLRHLIMMNVWESRESSEKAMIPHCRLITALMRAQMVLRANTHYILKPHKPLEMSKFQSTSWEYTRTLRVVTLRDKGTNQVLKGKIPNAPPLGEGEVEVDELMQENGNEDETGDEEVRHEEGGPSHVPTRSETRTQGPLMTMIPSVDQRATAIDTIVPMTVEHFAKVRLKRPAEFVGWPQTTQALYDQRSLEAVVSQERFEVMMRELRSMGARDEMNHRNRAGMDEMEVNSRYKEAEQERHIGDS